MAISRAENLKTDVLVVGLGSAGPQAAIKAARSGVSVLILGKGPLGKSGITPLIHSGYTAVTGAVPEDSIESHFKDIVVSGKYLCDQNLAEAMAEGGPRSVADLESYGVRFKREGGGYFLWPPLPGMSHRRMLYVERGGAGFTGGLRREVKKYPNIRVIQNALVTKILLRDGAACGAIVLDLREGIPLAIGAKAIVLATGGCEQIWEYTDCPPESTGDGLALAYEAGAELVDMEQQLFYPTIMVYPDYVRGLEIAYEAFVGTKVRLLNGRGDELTPPGEFPTRDELSNLMYREVSEGRGTEHDGIHVDLSLCTDSEKEVISNLVPGTKRLREFGIEIKERALEVAPAAHFTLGGIWIDEDCRTSVPGLFACGEVAANAHGANRLAGNALLETIVFGGVAGERAAAEAKAGEPIEPDGKIIREELQRLSSIMEPKKRSLRPFLLKRNLRKMVWEKIGLIRERERLLEAIDMLGALRDDLSRVDAPSLLEYNYDLIEAEESKNVLHVAEMVARASLFREESRGTHFRKDFPHLDNRKWIKHTKISRKGDEMLLSSAPVKMTKILPPGATQ